jgi:aminoglycoside phosphotransferase (APT) family kinase protein
MTRRTDQIMALPTIDEHLARRLVDSQFPQWARLPISSPQVNGHDHRTFRLGTELTVRLPTDDGYALQVDKEQRWLPVLAPRLPLPVPTPVAHGAPGQDYPYCWSIYRWLEGESASSARITDLIRFAADLAGFLVALRHVDAGEGPAPGPHNFFRGDHPRVYAQETVRAVDALGVEIPRDAVLKVWDEAVSTAWPGQPVWIHGDVAAANLLVRQGRLTAVIDFGCCGVGDPACDVVIAWTLLSTGSRDAFRSALKVDAATWARGRGWALWKALITLVEDLERGDDKAAKKPRRVIHQVLADRAYQR